jgi:hypothetical protein
MKRSAIAFVRGARIGVWMIRISAPEDRVERGSELVVPVMDQEPEPVGALAEVHEQVAGLLGHPGPGGVGGDPGDVHAAAAVLDNHEDVEAAQEDGVDVGEIDRQDRVGLRGQELSPGRPGSSWSRLESRALQDPPYGRGGHAMAEADQLALDAPVPQRGLSRAICSTRIRIGGGTGGRPGRRRG